MIPANLHAGAQKREKEKNMSNTHKDNNRYRVKKRLNEYFKRSYCSEPQAEDEWCFEDYYMLGGYKDPSSWRKEYNRTYRTICKQLIRDGNYEDFPPPKKDWRGYYW